MDLGTAREFLRAHHRAVLATSRADGRPQLSPVAATIDDEGRLLIRT
jgi:predicted pyridoxine 5'-phosphate oxidase superfamily flavin-nucleotide-binding protein